MTDYLAQLFNPSFLAGTDTINMTGVDIDQDGDLDVVVSIGTFPPTPKIETTPFILYNDGNGNLSLEMLPGTSVQNSIRDYAFADFNGDGDLDIFMGGHGYDTEPFPGEPNLLYLSDGNGGFIDATSNLPGGSDFTHSVAVGDVNNDGHSDVFVGNIYGQETIDPYLLLGAGDGTFLRKNLDPDLFNLFQEKYDSSHLADLDNDGQIELILGMAGGFTPRIVTWDENAQELVEKQILPTGRFGESTISVDAQTLDLNNDGRLDIVFSQTGNDYNGGAIQVLIQTNTGGFVDRTDQFLPDFDTGQGWIMRLQPADINGDGLTDLLTSQSPGVGPVAYINTGGSFVTVKSDYTIDQGVDEYLFYGLDPEAKSVFGALYYGDGLHITEVPMTEYGSEISVANMSGIKRSGLETDDIMRGGAARDELSGKNGDDTLYGDGGNDILLSGDGNDEAFGGSGDDTLYGDGGNDILLSGDGNDEAFGGSGNDTMYGGGGNDSLYGVSGTNEMFGGAGNDSLIAANDVGDFMGGGGGSDTVDGGTGNDTMYGSFGNDQLYGNDGDDYASGGNNNDLIRGGDGNDTLYGNGQRDTLEGGNNDDVLGGGFGSDVIDGGSGSDTVFAQTGNDTVYGGQGYDDIGGGANRDLLFGEQGNDTLTGGGGSDTLSGGAHDDVLNGNFGDDRLTGGNGADTFVFDANGAKTVTDFNASEGDRLQIDDAYWSGMTLTAAQVIDTYADDSSGTVILDFGSMSITLGGLSSVTGLENALDII